MSQSSDLSLSLTRVQLWVNLAVLIKYSWAFKGQMNQDQWVLVHVTWYRLRSPSSFFSVCFLFVSLLSCLLCVLSVRSPVLCVLLACWVSAQTSSVSLVSCFPISSCVFIVLSHPLVVSLSEFSAWVSHPSSASASLFSVFAQFRLWTLV